MNQERAGIDQERAVIGQKKAIIDQLWSREDRCVPGYHLSPLLARYGSWDSCKLLSPCRYQPFPDPYYSDTKLPLVVNKAVIYRQKVRILDTLDTFGYPKFWILCRNLGGQYPSIYDHPPKYNLKYKLLKLLLFRPQLKYSALSL